MQNQKDEEHILIADAGGTKMAWVEANRKTLETKSWKCTGVNGNLFSEDQIYDILKNEVLPHISSTKISEVHYYGAGCSTPSNAEKIARAISRMIPDAKVTVKTDVEGAARGLCGKEKGVACIIGTGSSACLFDGNQITVSREGLGYALGDEGGGAHLGKLLLQNYLMGHLDKNLKDKFIKSFGELSRNEILDSIYKKPAPNKYLGEFSTFYSENRGDPMIEKLLRKSISEFVEQSIVGICDDKQVPVNFTGSIACVFKDIVQEILEKWGLKPGKFMSDPMEGIVNYHIEN